MKYAVIVILLLATGYGLYYHYFDKALVMQRQTQQALDDFGKAVESKDRTKIQEALNLLLTPDAKIHLEIRWFSILEQNTRPAVQDFDHPAFVTFIDNLIYTFTDYGYEATIDKYTPASDHQSAAVSFSSREWANGADWFGGSQVNMRYSGETSCDADVIFTQGKPQIAKADCRAELRAVPQAGEEKKLQNPEALKQLLVPQH